MPGTAHQRGTVPCSSRWRRRQFFFMAVKRFPAPLVVHYSIKKRVFFMRNTSESPEGNEQATKPAATTRSRSSARSKSEGAAAGSQEVETKTVTRRRPAASTATGGAAAPSTQNGTGNT